MTALLQSFASFNFLSLLFFLIVAVSVVQGLNRGASGTARQILLSFALAMATAAAILTAWYWMNWSSPALRGWLTARNIAVPKQEMNGFTQIYYTLVTSLRDFSMMRSALLFLVGYALIKRLLVWIIYSLFGLFGVFADTEHMRDGGPWTSRLLGGLLGIVNGAGRALVLVAALFIYAALFPDNGFTQYVQQSQVYQKSAGSVIRPLTGDWLSERLPVLTKSAEAEFRGVLQRRYDVLDANVPDNIVEAAKKVTTGAVTDEDKARSLYRWVGTRVQYDWDKVTLYEGQGIWKEQSPEDTFSTMKGVCIDFARLYAVMARSVGLQTRVVTGLGYNGSGGYGAHAWNEVFLSESGKWVPLDPTWVASGGNWFNPSDFYDTHIKDA